jgi:transcriptional regulator with XRE-family HTH domain
MLLSSGIPNAKSIGGVRIFGRDGKTRCLYYPNMTSSPRHDWYLKAWMKTLKIRQADVMKATGYRRATMSELSTGKQRYNRDVINAVAAAMHIRPYELLMHPDEAMAIRRVRESAVRIAAEMPLEGVEQEGKNKSFG